MGHPPKTGQTWGTSNSTTPPSAKRGRKGRAPDCTVGQLERQLRNRLHRDPSTPLRCAQDDTAKTRAKTKTKANAKAKSTAPLRWRVPPPTSVQRQARHGAPIFSANLKRGPPVTHRLLWIEIKRSTTPPSAKGRRKGRAPATLLSSFLSSSLASHARTMISWQARAYPTISLPTRTSSRAA